MGLDSIISLMVFTIVFCTRRVPGGIGIAVFGFLAGANRLPLSAPEETTDVTQEIRELIDRILSSYDEIDARFTSAGGLGSILSLYEQVRRELERVSFQELDRMTGEIKNVIEALLTIEYELRKVQNLKLVFESRGGPGSQ